MYRRLISSCLFGFAVLVALPAQAERAAVVKTAEGEVFVERAGQRIAARPGTELLAGDVLNTGPDSRAGFTFEDNSRVALGPKTRYTIARYEFNSTTHEGQFDADLTRGSMAMVSGRLSKQSPEAVRVKTPSTVLAVRGTHFLVEIPEDAQ
ncbi:MAG: FecR domain-containing protein [Rhodocyclaceae bacterium]|nr:FecR domain-containing protein [Rhodocyclaceae bacterium]